MTSQNCKSPFRKALKLLTLLFITTIHLSFAQDVELGESLFSSNCASCHYLGPESKKLIGPGLNDHIFEEHSKDWLYSWIRNSSELIASGDEKAIALFEEYNKSIMTAFPYFTDDDIDNILAYIEAGPAEVEEVALTESEETSSSSNPSTILIVLLVALILFAVVYRALKMYSRNLKGIQRLHFLKALLFG